MKAILAVLCICTLSTAANNIDMLALGDSVFVTWNNYWLPGSTSGIGIWADSIVQHRSLDYGYCSIGIMDTGSDSLLLLTGADYSSVDFLLLDMNDLSTVDSMNLTSAELYWDPAPPETPSVGSVKILKQPLENNEVLFSCNLVCTLSYTYHYYGMTMGTVMVDPQSLALSVQTTAFWENETSNVLNYFRQIDLVTDSSGSPMTFAMVLRSYDIPYTPIITSLHSLCYRDSGSGAEIESMCFHSGSTETGMSGWIHASGSCSDRILSIWRNQGDNPAMNYSSYFDGQLNWSIPIPFDMPYSYSCNAMSHDPDDQGILLAWEDCDSDEIRVRHWDWEWNQYYHVIASDLDPVSIDVCYAEDGYFVGWLEETDLLPTLTFVPRETVTGIDSSMPVQQSAGCTAFPNPCRGDHPVSITGIPDEASIMVLDVTGRVVTTLRSASDGTFEWDLRDSFSNPCPAGVYVLLVEPGPTPETARLILLD